MGPDIPSPGTTWRPCAQWDTPTICNGLELVVPERRAIGFTVEPMVAVDRRFRPSSASPAPA